MAPTLDKDSQATLDGAKSSARALAERYRKLLPRWNRFAGGLRQGIANGSGEEIGLYRPEFGKVQKELDDTVSALNGALGMLANLNRDDEIRAKRFAEVEAIAKAIAPMRRQLLGWVDEARQLEKDAAKAAADAKTGDAAIETALATLKDAVADLKKACDDARKQAPKLEKAARDAHAAGQQKPLTEARVELIEIGGYATHAMTLRARVEKFRKDYPNADRDQKAEAQWLLDELQQVEDFFREVGKTAAELVKLGQVPVKKAPPPPPKLNGAQVKKIAALIGCDAKLADKLAKALNDNPHDKWPAAIAKATGMKEADVKAKMPSVNRLDFVRPLYLIDI